MGFFRLKTPADMLEKAKRERSRMVADVHIDHVYNFSVTAAHAQFVVYELFSHGFLSDKTRQDRKLTPSRKS
ncbi:hypothetical protein BN2475_280002 [Paraburkholderia ribeironis]|uniref:Uncharacterized protein n=1 Tax=Paraburkholderia ribeironis TaxID=1247936 RepID=A0A1N7S125_9BURK|nr:hypothetical protein BN2475_280002 [Paraburkholderia ribeironis]